MHYVRERCTVWFSLHGERIEIEAQGDLSYLNTWIQRGLVPRPLTEGAHIGAKSLLIIISIWFGRSLLCLPTMITTCVAPPRIE